VSATDATLRPGVAGLRRLIGRFMPDRDLGAVFKGATQVFAIRLAGAALAYVSMIFLARWLGAFQFGIYAYVWVGIVILGPPLSLGYASSALRFLPDYLARGKWRRLYGYLRESFVVVAVTSTAGALLGALLVWTFHDLAGPYYVPFLIGLLCLPLATVLNQCEATARAFGWVHLAYIPGYIARPIFSIAVVGALVWRGTMPNAADALWAIVGACIVAGIVQAAAVISGIRARVPATRPAYHTRHWAAISVSFVMIDGFRMLLENADILMIGRLLEPHSVAIYFAAARTAGLIAFIYFAVVALAVPKFSKIHITGTRAEMQKFVSGVIQLMFWPSLATAIVLAGLGPFALSLFGADFTSGYPTLLVVLAGLVVRASMGPVEYLLNMTGHHRDTMRVYGVAAVANIGLNLLLIPWAGIAGAAISTYIAIAGGNLWLYVLVRRRLGVSAFVFPIANARI